jgi:endonuclease/exonuclease/phosphatase family metal-dependent hydrolase
MMLICESCTLKHYRHRRAKCAAFARLTGTSQRLRSIELHPEKPIRNKLALLLVALLLVGCTHHPSQPVRLNVLTYNVHHGAGGDKKLDLERIAGVIRACAPDLVALQEVDQGTQRTGSVDQSAELGRLSQLHPVFGSAMEYDGGKFGDAVLSRLPIVSSKVVALPFEPGNKREPRIAITATVRLADGQEITFISTHLDHTRDPSDRLAQAQAINQTLGDLATPAILAGDFNCEPSSLPMRELEKIWTFASNGDPAPTCPADQPKTKIDHVLVKPADRWRIIDARVLDDAIASDHRPVLVKLELLPH